MKIGRIISFLSKLDESDERDKLVNALTSLQQSDHIESDLSKTEVSTTLSLLDDLTVRYISKVVADDKEIEELKEQLEKVSEAVGKLLASYHEFGLFDHFYQDGDNLMVMVRARSDRLGLTVNTTDDGLTAKIRSARKGQVVRYLTASHRTGTSKIVIDISDSSDTVGSVNSVKEVLADSRLLVSDDHGHETVVECGLEKVMFEPGDKVLVVGGVFVTEKLQKTAEVQELRLQQSLDLSWDAVGGLEEEISKFRKKVERRYVYSKETKLFEIPDLKGVLFIGPPGCGKSLLARVAVNQVAKYLTQKLGREVKGFYLLINGPADVLRKFVGDSPGRIKSAFDELRKEVAKGNLAFLILEECDSWLTIRQAEANDAGVRNELVTQVNAEMDGILGLNGAAVIALTNRPEMIDPAIMRRFNLKIIIPRPDKPAALDIFVKNIQPSVPIHSKYFDPKNYEGDLYYPRDKKGDKRTADGHQEHYLLSRDRTNVIGHFAAKVMNTCYDTTRSENQFLRIKYRNGQSETLTFADFMSGDLIVNYIISNAKERALDRYIESGDPETEGLKLKDFYEALDDVFRTQLFVPKDREAFNNWLEVNGISKPEIKDFELVMDKKTGPGELAKKKSSFDMA